MDSDALWTAHEFFNLLQHFSRSVISSLCPSLFVAKLDFQLIAAFSQAAIPIPPQSVYRSQEQRRLKLSIYRVRHSNFFTQNHPPMHTTMHPTIRDMSCLMKLPQHLHQAAASPLLDDLFRAANPDLGPKILFMFSEALSSFNNFTIALCRQFAAIARSIRPYSLSTVFSSASLSINNFTIVSCPSIAAISRGKQPYSLSNIVSAASLSINNFTIAVFHVLQQVPAV